MKTDGNDKRSALKMACAMLIFGTIGIFRNYIPLSSALLACVRGIFGALFLFCIAKMQKRKYEPRLTVKEKLWFLLSGCLIGFNWMFLFEAYRYTGVQTATLCYYTQPVIVVLASPVFFHEKLNLRKILCALFAAAGMFLVCGSGGESEFTGILYGLCAACLYAGVVIFNKKAPAADAWEKTILQLAAAGCVMMPYLLITGGFACVPLSLMDILLTACVCLIHTGLAYMLYFSSMDGLQAQTIARMGYIDPLSALFLSALILHESLSLPAMAGAVMIILSALIAETGG